MNTPDHDRMWMLFKMANECSVGEAHATLRDAALSGIESELIKQGCAMQWLRHVLHHCEILSFASAGLWIVMVRCHHTGSFCGGSGLDENEAAASTIARYLPYAGLLSDMA